MHEHFKEGAFFPPTSELERLDRYKETEMMMENKYEELAHLFRNDKKLIIALNIAPLIIKKGVDFLVGNGVQVSTTDRKNTQSQATLERIKREHNLDVFAYEAATEAAKKGDAFVKVSYSQRFGGEVDIAVDPIRPQLELLQSEYIFPVTAKNNSHIVGYYYAVPSAPHKGNCIVKTAFYGVGYITYKDYEAKVVDSEYITDPNRATPTRWKLGKAIGEPVIERTGVDENLIVHIKNPLPKSGDWQGTDDLNDVKPILDEINTTLTRMADSHNKHADPMLVVPQGALKDEQGRPRFRVASSKVMEAEKGDILPQYVNNANPLMVEQANHLKFMVSKAYELAEIPELLLGAGNSGTSGSSGTAVDKRLSGVYAKSRRKRQYFTESLKAIYRIIQKMENATGYASYDIAEAKLLFDDEIKASKMEETTMKAAQVQNKLLSRKTAMMQLHSFTEEEALEELSLIESEERADLNAIRTYNSNTGGEDVSINYTKRVTNDQLDDELADDLKELGFV